MSESIKAAREAEREKAWELEIASGDDLQEEFTALLSSFPPDDAFRIFAGGFFEQGFEAAQKVADEQTADLRNRLEALIRAAEAFTGHAGIFNAAGDSTGAAVRYKALVDAIMSASEALKELQEATK
jgi:hypothetical protein